MSKQVYSFKECSQCGSEFIGSNLEEACNDCLGVDVKVTSAPTIGNHDRLGDTRFKQAPQEWNDLLKKIKRENPGSTIEIK